VVASTGGRYIQVVAKAGLTVFCRQFSNNIILFQPSVFELAHLLEFPTLPIIPEDFIKDHGGKYTSNFDLFIFIALVLCCPIIRENKTEYG
jgi:hypothetical protein